MEPATISKEDKLRDYILFEVNESLAYQQKRIKEVKDYTKRYEAKRSISGLIGWGDDPKLNPKNFPWEGASDVGIPLDAFTIEGLLPRFLKVCYGSKPIAWVRGTAESDIEKAPIVQQALNYQLTRMIKIYRKMKLVFKTVVIEGDGFVKCIWGKETRKFNKVVRYLQNPITGERIYDQQGVDVEVKEDHNPQPIDEFGTLPKVVKDDKQDEKTVYEGPLLFGRTVKELIIPKNADSPDIQEWDWVCDTYDKTFDWLTRNEGDMKEGKFDIGKIRKELLEKSTNHQKAMRVPIKIYEWHGKYDIDEDGKDEEIIAFASPKYKHLLGWMLSPFPIRPFFHYQIIPMEGSPYGKGVPEFLIGLRDMVDAVFNQMIDRGSINNNPPTVVPPDHEDELAPYGPGVKWKSDNPHAYKVLELPKSEQIEFAKMEFLLGMVQKLFGVTDYSLGSESSIASNRTASGIMTIVGEGNIKFDEMIRALQDINEDLYEFIVNLNADKLDDDFIFQLTEKKENPFKSIKKAYWAGNFDFESAGNSININRQIEQERAAVAYRTVIDTADRNPVLDEKTMVDVTENYFNSLDARGVRLKPLEQIEQEKKQAQEAQQQAIQAEIEVKKAEAKQIEIETQIKMTEAQTDQMKTQIELIKIQSGGQPDA